MPSIEISVAGFALLWAGTYAALLALYFVPGLVMEWLAQRHPERRIQARPSTHKGRDIRQSV
ncbi:MAG: hypothetical protein AAGD12_15045, partial [Pseudomonadota bacterium]